MIDEERIRSEAEGFIMLGLYDDAWELVETLPAETHATPPMRRIRLACAMAAKRFDLAKDIARELASGNEADARFAARVLHELAAVQYLSGEETAAKELLAAAIAAHPEQRKSILEDPQLKHLL